MHSFLKECKHEQLHLKNYECEHEFVSCFFNFPNAVYNAL